MEVFILLQARILLRYLKYFLNLKGHESCASIKEYKLST